MSDAPRLAIVIPVYGHPMLVTEALCAALAQKAEFGIHIVAVNDGCPQEETHLVLSAFALAHPGRVTCLTRPNGGLSAARNAGIAHVLAHLPSVEAVFMLDADNRLRPQAMARAMAQLEAHPEAGWVYPSIDMFGIPARCDYGGPYARLIHSEMNVSEAGSLIRRAVFEAGVLFDETFRQGFEDWHFFLSAGDAGFAGVNLEDFGFFYRKRPESMLANADRHRDALVAQVRRAHSDLYRPATQLRLEHDEAPRYALWDSARDAVRLVTDPERAGPVLSRADYARAFWHSRTAPAQARVPPFLVVADAALLQRLSDTGTVHWALWQLEVATGEGMARARLTAPPRAGEIACLPAGSEAGRAALWTLSAEAVATLLAEASPVDPEAPGDAGPACTALALRMDPPPGPPAAAAAEAPTHDATEALRSALDVLHASPYHGAGQRRWGWRQPSIGWRGKEHRILRKTFGGQPPLPRVPGPAREIGLITEDVDATGLQGALEALQGARAQGGRLTLFVLRDRTGPGLHALRDRFDAIALLGAAGFSGERQAVSQFHAIHLSAPTRAILDDQALALMAGLDEVHVLASPGADRLMGALRRQGIATALHLPDTASDTALTLALAYEHAYDRIILADAGALTRMRALGLPEAKLCVAGADHRGHSLPVQS